MPLSILEEPHTPTVTLDDLDLTREQPQLTRTSGKVKKERKTRKKRKSTGPNVYARWVQEKIQHDPEIRGLPAKQRFKRCGELWKLEKQKKEQPKL